MNEAFPQGSNLILGSREWLLAACILATVIACLTIWSYWQRGRSQIWRWTAAALKVAAVAALAVCLLEPMLRIERPRPGANVVAIVVDNSRSMEITPPGQSGSRRTKLNTVLASDVAWQARLAQDFDVRRYAFDERMQSVDKLGSLEFLGNHSALGTSIRTLQTRFATRPVAGLILFSDGLATDDIQNLLSEDDFAFPIYPVVQGIESASADITLRDAQINLSSFELAPATAEVSIQASGLAGEEISVRLMDQDGVTLEKQTLACESNDFEQRVRFRFRPTEPGFQWVNLQARLASEDSSDGATSSQREVTLENNSQLLAVNRGGGPYRILYVAGRPNWEFKFLRRALEEDVELELKGLVRIAKQEPKFSFRDRGIETTNPLLAGFSDDEETAEQYDEPVLLRLGVREDELKAGFPSGKEDLYEYDAIILDDVEAGFFTQQQMLLMRQFVAERGGGLMMLGGQEEFVDGGYRDTPLGDVLPVYLRGRTSGPPANNSPVRYRLTREGSLEPWLRLRANQSDEAVRVDKMPAFQTWHSIPDAKPGASVLAQLENEEEVVPGLVAQRFGRGRSLALMIGDYWRWGMRRPETQNNDLAQSWRQIARWLTNDVPKRLEVDVGTPDSPLGPHQLVIQLKDPAFSPLDNASVEVQVVDPTGEQITATAAPDQTRPGFYVAEYWSKIDGGYTCLVRATSPDGEVFEPTDTGWTAQPSQVEFSRIQPDRALLQELADVSQGRLIEMNDLDAFVSQLPTQKVPITETRIEPIWHKPWFVLFAIGCLCLEWGIRRWKGLP